MNFFLKMADAVDVLKVTLVHGSKKHAVELSANQDHEDLCTSDTLTVSELVKLASRVTQVPQDAMKLIFKGQSLKDTGQTLESLGIANGAKIMIIGKKHNLEVESMKTLRSIESRTSDTEKRLLGYIAEVDGVEKGFVPSDIVQEALHKLSVKLRGTAEEFMKTLESLDALSIDASLQQPRLKRKTLVQRIQGFLDKADATLTKIEELKTKERT